MSEQWGKIVQVMGPVVDVEFPEGHIPAIYNALKLFYSFDLVIITLSWGFSQVQIIRAFRIFRAFRLITRIKVLKNLVLGRSCACVLAFSCQFSQM